MDININGGNNLIAPNLQKIEQTINITIDLHGGIITVIANLVFYLLG